LNAKRERDAQTAFEAGGQLGLAEKSDIARRATQLFDNLIGHNEVIRQKFEYKLERENDPVQTGSKLTRSNESLIPAQNQRWRRA
jgi:hypothetical protein